MPAAAERSPLPIRADDPAFAVLYRAHGAAIAARLRALGVREAAIEDAIQDVFLIAFRRAEAYEGRSSARAWLLGIARRIASRYRRGDTRASRRHAAFAVIAQAHAVPDHFAGAERRYDLARVIGSLDPDRRHALVGAIEGRTREELGDVLGVRPTTAYSRLVAARRTVAAWLGDTDDVEPPRRRARAVVLAFFAWPARLAWFALVLAGGVVALQLHARAHDPRPAIDSDPPGNSERARAWADGAPAVRSTEIDSVVSAGPVPDTARGQGLRAAAPIDEPNSSPAARTHTRARPPRSAAPRKATGVRDDATPSADLLPSTPVRPVTSAPEATPSPPPTTAAATASDLRIELDLLIRARRAGRAGRPAEGQALLDEHARRFPFSSLSHERERTQAMLLDAEPSSIPGSAGTPLP